MKKSTLGILIVVLVVLVLARASLYSVKEGRQVVITQFGKPVAVVTDAGLNVKTPFIQQVNELEKRLLPWDGDPLRLASPGSRGDCGPATRWPSRSYRRTTE